MKYQADTDALKRLRALVTAACMPALLAAQGPPERPVSLVMEIGADATGKPGYTFGTIGALEVDSAGNIHVVDPHDCAIKVFDARGSALRRFGQRGSGPGEFSCVALGLRIVGAQLRVTDPTANRSVVFGLDGRHIRTEMLPAIAGDFGLMRSQPLRYGFRLRSEGGSVSNASGFRYHPYAHYVVRHESKPALDTIASLRQSVVRVEPEAGPTRLFSTPFGFGGSVAVLDDSVIAVVDGFAGNVTWLVVTPDGVRRARSASIGSGRPVTAADRREMEARVRAASLFAGQGPLRITGAQDRWSVTSRALFTSDGSLWIRLADTSARGMARWVVFDRSATLAYSVALPPDFGVLAIRDGLIYGRTTDANGVPVVRIYR